MGSDLESGSREQEAPPFRLERRGVALRPDPASPHERGGVLNPAAVLHEGVTYLFYRAVAETPNNYSRILIATCRTEYRAPDTEDDGAGAHDTLIETVRLGKIALEPEAE